MARNCSEMQICVEIERFVLEACPVKMGGSLARNDHFGSLFCEI